MTRDLIFDIETDGFLEPMTTIHCIVVRDVATRSQWRFRRRHAGIHKWVTREADGALKSHEQHFEAEDTLEEGVDLLMSADTIIGHNSIAFDSKAVRKIFPRFIPPPVRDSMVLTRVLQSDVKQRDFKRIAIGQGKRGRAAADVARLSAELAKARETPDFLAERIAALEKELQERAALAKRLIPGEVPGSLAGKHTLDAWGFRLGLHKGTYQKDMEAAGLSPWAQWNPAMEDYCVNDIDVTEALWAAIQSEKPPLDCVELEHAITDLTSVMEANGFPFNRAAAVELATRLRSDLEPLISQAVNAFGRWAAPEKKYQVRALWDDTDGVNKKKVYKPPRPEFGEDRSRAIWGEVTVPKKAMRFRSSVHPALCAPGATHSYRSPDAPYCKMVLKEFNPGSRHHIIDRFTTVHGWEPADFTDKGNPIVDDDVLRALGKSIPAAEACAEIFFLQKLLGYVDNGRESWLKHYDERTGSIHGHINTGGTPTGRCSHLAPNIAQVPKVVEADVLLKDGSLNPLVLGTDGDPLPECYKDGIGSALKKKIVLKGRPGRYGWECRSLFYMPPPFMQVGVDLSSIEFRCLAELCAEFDGGELINVVLTGDIHQYNKDKSGVETRDIAKRCLYALMYGAGDYKLGITAYPNLATSPDAARRAGKIIRAQLMDGLPALNQAIKRIQHEARTKGYIFGLDGRKVKIRSEHSALNFRLQGDAALIAKLWAVLTEQYALDLGLRHHWSGDFVMVAFVHDELQNGVHREHAKAFAQASIAAAAEAGKRFGFKCPVAAEAKIGGDWAECH